jgi:hypothetical protein
VRINHQVVAHKRVKLRSAQRPVCYVKLNLPLLPQRVHVNGNDVRSTGRGVWLAVVTGMAVQFTFVKVIVEKELLLLLLLG